jgi:hypothetical protein
MNQQVMDVFGGMVAKGTDPRPLPASLTEYLPGENLFFDAEPDKKFDF